MNSVQILSVIISGLLLLVVLELVRRRKLTEEHSFIWILCALALLVFSVWRDLLHIVAQWLGIFYPPIVLLLLLILFVFVGLLYFSVVISTQRRQIEDLLIEVALLAEDKTPASETRTRSNSSPESGFRSRFGGLWTDRVGASRRIRDKLLRNQISAGQASLLEHWIEHGWVLLEKAVLDRLVDEVNDDVDRAWRGQLPDLWVEHWQGQQTLVSPIRSELRDQPHKLLDLYSVSEAARQAIFAPPILDFLGLVFERDAMAFQSLSFLRGSGQPMHQDTAYVKVSSPLEFVASWIALEDIAPDSGVLEYYDGSHRLPEFLFAGACKNMPEGDPDHDRYLAWLHQQARVLGLGRKTFQARKGDVFIWSADLVHGGSRDIAPNSTRRSLVTHYCPSDIEPGYFSHTRHSARIRKQQIAENTVRFTYVSRGAGS